MGLGSRGVWEEGSQLIGATDPRTPRIGDTGSMRFNSEVQAIPTSDEQKQAPWGRRWGGGRNAQTRSDKAQRHGISLSGQTGSLSSMDEVKRPGLWKGFNLLGLIPGEMGQKAGIRTGNNFYDALSPLFTVCSLFF